MSGAGTTAKFDLTLSLEEHDGGLAGAVEYATDLFDAATIDRLIGHFERLLAAALAAPERPRSRSCRCSRPAERHQLLVEWNDTATAALRTPACSTSCSRARRRGRRTPSPWLARDEALTYAELDAPGQPAGPPPARALGVGPDVLVGLLRRALARTWSSASSASSRPAAPTCRSIPAIRAERLAFMLDDARVAGAADPGAAARPAAGRHGLPVVLLDGAMPAGDGERRSAPRSRRAGQPGLRDLHLGLDRPAQGGDGPPPASCNRLLLAPGSVYLGSSRHDRRAPDASLCFDISVWEIFGRC